MASFTNNSVSAGAGGAGAGGAANEELEENKTNILILGHGAIDSNKFIIIPEHIDLTFYTNKGESFITKFNKFIISKKGDKNHYIKEKTLLNDMNISLNNIFQYDNKINTYSDVINIENTHIIGFSGIISTKKITPINMLPNEIYNSYNIHKIKIIHDMISIEELKTIIKFDPKYIQDTYIEELKSILNRLVKISKLYDVNILELARKYNIKTNITQYISLNQNNKFELNSNNLKKLNNYKEIDTLVKELIILFNKNEIKNQNIYKTIKYNIDIIFNNYNFAKKKFLLFINILQFIYSDFYKPSKYSFIFKHFMEELPDSLYIFDKENIVLGYNNNNYINILNNILFDSNLNLPGIEFAYTLLISIYNSLLIKDKNYPLGSEQNKSICQFINEEILPNHYKEHFLNNAWPNIRNLSYHYHNNEIISKEEIIKKNYNLNLGYILHKIDMYNKNVLGNKKILCHGLNCRNYTPIKSNRNITQLQKEINKSISNILKKNEVETTNAEPRPNHLELVKETLKRANSLSVHSLIRLPSASEEYKSIFENIIEKCKAILYKKIQNVNNLQNKATENNMIFKSFLNKDIQKITNIEENYNHQHFLTKEDIKFLIHILGRSE